MNTRERLYKNCYVFCPAISFIIIITIFMSYVYKQIDTINYNEYDCYIENVSYPTIFINTSTNDIILDGFVNCNCGHKCTTNFGICIKIFGRILKNNQTKLLQDKTIDSPDDTCTFRENKCKNAQDLSDRIQATSDAKDYALSYLNTTRNCYSKNNEYYFLNNHINLTGIIICSVIIGLIIIGCLSIILLHLFNHEENIKIYNGKNKRYNRNNNFEINYI